MPGSTSRFDVHHEITNRIVDAIESAGEFQLPWLQSNRGGFSRPINVESTKPYNGVNIISLWISALDGDYASNVWGTYRQWQAKGAQVRRGEKSSLVVFYKTVAPQSDKDEPVPYPIARASWVFNAAQVDGFLPTTDEVPEGPTFDPIATAEEFASATGAQIGEGGDRAYYDLIQDRIQMPDRQLFLGSRTSTPAMAFYATLCHELVHWSGAGQRLDRNLRGRFGDQAYAMEELVAELGSAFLCADLGLTPEPREDHACYIKNWLAVMKNDKRAIFAAASKASQAATWLLARNGDIADKGHCNIVEDGADCPLTCPIPHEQGAPRSIHP